MVADSIHYAIWHYSWAFRVVELTALSWAIPEILFQGSGSGERGLNLSLSGAVTADLPDLARDLVRKVCVLGGVSVCVFGSVWCLCCVFCGGLVWHFKKWCDWIQDCKEKKSIPKIFHFRVNLACFWPNFYLCPAMPFYHCNYHWNIMAISSKYIALQNIINSSFLRLKLVSTLSLWLFVDFFFFKS